MATQLQIRRGTSTQVAAFTGAEGEIVVNTTNDSVHVNDGSTAGGFELARADFNNISASATLTIGTLNTTNLDLTNLEVTNIKAKDGTAAGSIADSTGVVTLISSSLTTADITTLKIGGTTVTATAAELNYVDGVTSAIQTQIDAKAPIANPTFTGSFTSPGIDDNADAIAITIDSSENVGIGGAPNAGWRNDATDRILTLGTEAAFHSDAGVTTELWNNAYVDNSDTFKNISTRGASRYMQYSGAHKWFTAASASAGSTISTEINSSPKMVLDVNGNLGIGTSSPSSYSAYADNLVVAGAAQTGITIASGNSTQSGVYFSDGTSGAQQYAGYLDYNHNSEDLFIGVGAQTRVTIDGSNGNVGIGNSTVASTRFAVTGSVVGANIETTSSNSSHEGLIVNRQNSDGIAIAVNKAGSTVGLIGTNGGTFYISAPSSSGAAIVLNQNANIVYPGQNSSGTVSVTDNAIDLGASAVRFKDLHMSGIGFFGLYGTGVNSGNVAVGEGVYVGAISSANQLRSSSEGGSSSTLYIGNAAIQVSSDQRLKTNIVDTEMDALEKVNQVRIVDFNWDDPSDTSFNNRNARGKWTGVLAQELVDIFPFAVNAPRNESDLSIDTDSEQRWLVDQAQMVPVLIKAIQEQQDLIEALTARITALEGE